VSDLFANGQPCRSRGAGRRARADGAGRAFAPPCLMACGLRDLPESCRERLLEISGYPEAFFEKGSPEYPNPMGVSFRSLRSLTAGSRNAAMAAGALAFELDDWITEQYELPCGGPAWRLSLRRDHDGT
jgi:hypothetical protein